MASAVAHLEKKYLAYQAFRNLWFVGAIWLLYYRLFISDQQVGVLDAISFGIGLLAEIPAGALADRFGRKKLVIVGVSCIGSGMLLQGLANGYGMILFGQAIMSVGWALCSGADTSLFYDALKYKETTSHWKKLVNRGGQVGLCVTLLCYVIGAYMFKLSPRLPFIVDGIATFSAIAVIWNMKEPRAKKTKKQAFSSYISDITDGLKQLGSRQAIVYIPMIVTLQGLFYAFGYGLLRPILQTRFGFDASGGAWVLVACGVVTFILQRRQHKNISDSSEKRAITTIALCSVFALVAACFNIGYYGFFVIAVLYASEYLLEPWMSDGINKNVSSQHRATALSAASFLKALPYVIVAPLIGYLNVRGMLSYYLISMAVLSLMAVLLYRTLHTKSLYKEIQG